MRHIFSNCLQSEPISCIVSDGKAQGFAFFILNIQFHIAIRCIVTEACRPAGFGARERENHSTGAVRTRPFRSSESCLGESQSLRKYFREKTGNGRGNQILISRVQVRRTAVSAAFAAKRMNAWDELCFRIQGSRPPFCTCTKMAVFFSRDVCAPCSRSCMIYHRSLR